MDPITAGLIAGGVGLVGSYMTNQANTDIANSANTAAQQRQDQANAFNAQQYATRYQTTVKDLQEAGLNPMLAYGQGAGSPIPANAAPVQMAAPRINALSNASQAFLTQADNAANLKLKAEQVNATNAQTEVFRTQGIKNTADALEAVSRTEKYGPEIDVLKNTLKVQAAQIESLKAGALSSSASAARDTAAVGGNLPQQQPWWYDKLQSSASKAAQNFQTNVKGWTNSAVDSYKKYQNYREFMLGGSK